MSAEAEAVITARGVELGADLLRRMPRLMALVRKELTVAPLSLNDPFPKKFKVYLESPTGRVVVPYHWARTALAPFGIRFRDARDPGKDADLRFRGALRPDLGQPEAVAAVERSWAECGGAMLCLAVGFGKCLDPATPVLTYDGDTILADDLTPGMRLMGMDGTPRTVLDVGRGTEAMYEIRPVKGDPWRCNESHILSLRYSGHGAVMPYGQGGGRINYWELRDGFNVFSTKVFRDAARAHQFATQLPRNPVVDIAVRDYLRLPRSLRANLKLFRPGRMSFETDDQPQPLFDPYVLGAWLGDGTSVHPTFTLADQEVVDEIRSRCAPYDMHLTKQNLPGHKAPMYYLGYPAGHPGHGRVNPFTRMLREYGILGRKRIPVAIRRGSVATRLAVLGGLLDTDGYLSGNCFEITQKSAELARDIVFVARSLGFAAQMCRCEKVCVKSDGTRVPGTYSRVSIYGAGLDDIPTVLPRKRAAPRLQRRDALVTGFECVPVGDGRYVGPVLDGDHRFLLEDFTVTHNTTCALYLAARLRKKALVLVHKAFLKDQWKERVGQCLPGAKVTEVQGDTCDTSGDVVIAMIQTLVSRKYPPTTFADFGVVIIDEVHHIGAQAFSQCMWGLCAPRVLGLSATPTRKDGLTRVVSWFAGPVAFSLRRENQDTTHVKVVKYTCPEFDAPPPVNRRGDVCFTTVITRLTENEARTQAIAREVRDLATQGRDVLVLSHRRQHVYDLASRIAGLGVECGTYVGGDKTCPDTKVVVATYALTSEGFDLPRLNALVLATPASDVEQSCGRVMRGSSTRGAIIVDVVDQWGVCFSQHAKRRGFYKRGGFTMVTAGTGTSAAAAAADSTAAPAPGFSGFAFVEDDD